MTTTDARIRRAMANSTKGAATRMSLPGWVRDLDLDTVGTYMCGDLACAKHVRVEKATAALRPTPGTARLNYSCVENRVGTPFSTHE